MVRKYAFHMILAGHRFNKASQVSTVQFSAKQNWDVALILYQLFICNMFSRGTFNLFYFLSHKSPACNLLLIQVCFSPFINVLIITLRLVSTVILISWLNNPVDVFYVRFIDLSILIQDNVLIYDK